MLLSAMIAAFSGAVAKVLSTSMDPIEIVFYRNFLGVIIILFSLKKVPVDLNKSKLHLLFFKRFLWNYSYVIVLLYNCNDTLR